MSNSYYINLIRQRWVRSSVISVEIVQWMLKFLKTRYIIDYRSFVPVILLLWQRNKEWTWYFSGNNLWYYPENHVMWLRSSRRFNMWWSHTLSLRRIPSAHTTAEARLHNLQGLRRPCHFGAIYGTTVCLITPKLNQLSDVTKTSKSSIGTDRQKERKDME